MENRLNDVKDIFLNRLINEIKHIKNRDRKCLEKHHKE